MRIALTYRSLMLVGGLEVYLTQTVARLSELGHSLSFLHETSAQGQNAIKLPRSVQLWCAQELGQEQSIVRLKSWQPDVIYAHGLKSLALESATLDTAPGVYYAHGYSGTCISGGKTLKFPHPTPCGRILGPGCLLRYFPRRCGGLNPLTMLSDYNLQSGRLALLARYRLILSNSKHMQQEFTRHGLKTKCLSLGVRDLRLHSEALSSQPQQSEKPTIRLSQNGRESPGKPWRLLFLGRMDRLKGGALLIESLLHLTKAGSPEVILTLAGDGPEKSSWERKAKALLATTKRISVHFPGWLDEDATRQILSTTDLLVIPSVWPEPFGLVGPEAGLAGVPAVAFNVGGITDWLTNDVNGLIAEADPPKPENLAKAITQCLSDPATYARLSRSAAEEARRFIIDAHAFRLLEILDRVRSEGVN